MKMNTFWAVIRVIAVSGLLAFQAAMATVYNAPVIVPFSFEALAFTADGQVPGFRAYNDMRGLDRTAFNQGGWISGAWNSDVFLSEEDSVDSGVVNFTANHFTTLTNRMGPWTGPDPEDDTRDDIVFYEGRSAFAPFDNNRGMLNEVTIQFDWSLDTLLTMSLCDDGFIHNAEGHVTASTHINHWLGESRIHFGDTLEAPTSIGHETDWSCFAGSVVDNLNTGGWGGAPSLYDAAQCFLNPDLCQYEAVDWSSNYLDTLQISLQQSETFTPEEYTALLDSNGNFNIYSIVNYQHHFSFEGGDTFDSSTYTSMGEGRLSVAYDYSSELTSVPEPDTLVLISLGLVGLGFARRHKQS